MRALCIEVHSADPSKQSAEEFDLHFSVARFGSHSTFVLYTALLTGRLSLSDVQELATLWAILTVTATL